MSDRRRTPASKAQWLRSILGKNAKSLSFIRRERRFYDLFGQQDATIAWPARVGLHRAPYQSGFARVRAGHLCQARALGA